MPSEDASLYEVLEVGPTLWKRYQMEETAPITRVASYAVLLREGHILLCRLSHLEKHVGKWTLPGGGLEFGEHPRDAAVREVFEETGYQIQVKDVLTVDSEEFTHLGRPMHAIRIIYEGAIIGGDLTAEVDGTTDSAAWISLREAESLATVPLARLGLSLAKAMLEDRPSK